MYTNPEDPEGVDSAGYFINSIMGQKMIYMNGLRFTSIYF